MPSAHQNFPTREICGTKMHAVRMTGIVQTCGSTIVERGQLLIGVVNAAKLVNMERDPVLRRSIDEADVVLADGMAVVWAGRLLGQPLPERVAGVDLFYELLTLAQDKGFSVYLLGARQSVLDVVVEEIERQWPGVQIVGARNGYFAEENEPEIVEEIRRAQPDMLFVGISSPKKEVFLGRWARLLGVPVCHGVGGSFDVLAGKTRRAPRLLQRLGLEWLYRVVQEPRRLCYRYLVTNTLFIGMLLRELRRKAMRRRAGTLPAQVAGSEDPAPTEDDMRCLSEASRGQRPSRPTAPGDSAS